MKKKRARSGTTIRRVPAGERGTRASPKVAVNKVQAARAQARAAKAEFAAAHRKGMDALEAGDSEKFGEAIREEREAIERVPVPRPRAKRR